MVTEKGALVKANTEILPSIAEAMQLGPILIESGMFPGISSKAQAVAKILAGREIGFGPIYSLQMIDLVKGRLHLRSEAMAALINRSGRYRYEVNELTGEKAVIDFFVDGKKVLTSIFTLDDARRADLVKADSGWIKYPRDMLWSRAMTFGAKKVCPELLAGFEALEDGGIEVVEEEITKAGEPPPSAWMRFWGAARKKGYNDDDSVHKVLGVESVKAWLDQGKSLDDALKALPNLQAEKDAVELFGNGKAEPVKIIIARPAPTATEPPNPSPIMGEGNNSRAQGPGGKTSNTVAKDEGYPPVQNWGEMAAKINNLGVTSTSVISRAGYKRWQDFTDNCGGVEGGFRKAWEIAQAIKAGK